MPEDLSQLLMQRRPTAQRPLLGLTILAVEDSRFACEAMRLLCQHSGARLRRADCLANARRHLSLYRPTAVLVDMGLPDGSGADLIAELHQSVPRVPVLLAVSGNPETRAEAMEAGAQEFLEKPLTSLAAFQATILAHMPDNLRPNGPRRVPENPIAPDRIALRDDLARLAEIISVPCSSAEASYAAQFLASIACSADDPALADAARSLAALAQSSQDNDEATRMRVTDVLQERIDATMVL